SAVTNRGGMPQPPAPQRAPHSGAPGYATGSIATSDSDKSTSERGELGDQPLAVHQRGDEAEHDGFRLRLEQVGELGELGEAAEVRTRRALLDDDREEVAADDGDQSVEQQRDDHHRADPRNDEPVQRADAERLHRVDLVADLAGAEV